MGTRLGLLPKVEKGHVIEGLGMRLFQYLRPPAKSGVPFKVIGWVGFIWVGLSIGLDLFIRAKNSAKLKFGEVIGSNVVPPLNIPCIASIPCCT